MRPVRHLIPCLLLILGAGPAWAQDRLWVTGTLTYHRLWHEAPRGGEQHGSSLRIMGRLGFRAVLSSVGATGRVCEVRRRPGPERHV